MRKEYRYYVALLVLFFAYLAWTLLSSDSRPGCLIKAVTGLPCPGCGTSRALELLLHGCLWQSLCTNPLGLLLLLAAITSSFWIATDFVRKSNSFHNLMRRPIKTSLLLILILLTIANWLWNIHKGF